MAKRKPKSLAVEGKPPEVSTVVEGVSPTSEATVEYIQKTFTEDPTHELARLKEEKLKLLVEKRDKIAGLPHRHGFKYFPWQREFFDCHEKDVFLTAANQVGKSTIAASQAIEWCGNKALWKKLWKGKVPRQIWYLYPSQDFATSEVYSKWIPDLLPKDSMKDDPDWGWEIEKNSRHVYAIKFNSGASIYFKAYSQDVSNLQGSTVAAIFCDEELPEDYWDELNFRRMAYNGHFRMVFTATLGQKTWYDTMERQGTKEEKFPHAKKMQISLHMCKKYEDGSDSHIDDEYIRRAISLCKSEAEVQKRVMGRFAMDSGLKYAAFDRKKNIISSVRIPSSWPVYVGVDVGGGGDGHPSAIMMCAVSPDYTSCYVFDGWVGEGELTTNMDVYDKLVQLIEKHSCFNRLAGIFYDYQSKDFGTICSRKGLSVIKADKSHSIGESVLNVLFKNGSLLVFDLPSLDELVFELTNLKLDTAKRSARDDAADALRYCLTRVPFNWAKLGVANQLHKLPEQVVLTREEQQLQDRRSGILQKQSTDRISIEEELSAWEELYDF